MKQKIIILSILATLFAGCASQPRTNSTARTERETSPVYRAEPGGAVQVRPDDDAPLNVDHVGLQRSLGMDRDTRQLGYAEKAFQTCQAGYGFPSSRNCERRHFVVIHFQLLCRDSEGTLQTPLGREDMRALSRATVNWTMLPESGEIVLDEDGFGKILTTVRTSPRAQRLKLSVGEDFLYTKAGEINRVVAPAPFCP